MLKSRVMLLSLLLIVGMIVAACGGAATPAPEQPAAEEPAAEQPAEEAAPAEEEAEEVMEEEAPAEKTVLNVWSFTNEIMTMAIAYEGKNPDVDVVYTMIPMTNGEYQTKLKAALGTADAPDVIALEAAFVKELVESDVLADISDLKADADAAKTYPVV